MSIVKQKNQVEILHDCIVNSIKNYDFSWSHFFDSWFRTNGTPLYFLFKKNLSVTNTQYAELFSLLNLHTQFKNEEFKLLFYTTDHIRSTFTELINTLIEDYNPKDTEKIRNFCKQYIDVFGASVAIDLFFGSCSVFLPVGIKLNLKSIVYEAGYIHSAGQSIFIRNIKKTRKNDFVNQIKAFLTTLSKSSRLPFIIYSHEDFSGFDKNSSELIDRGIENCKMYIEKMNMSSYRLTTVISEMQSDVFINKKLDIPKPGNYQKHHNFKSDSSIWLITDKSISGGSINNPGQHRYYICYHQTVKNESPFYYFDENKPAWKSHTTMPHSLTSALLNISRLELSNGKIIDPFGGTGTTWFEAKRLGLKNQVECRDLSPSAALLVKDNLSFFQLNHDDLEHLIKFLQNSLPDKNIPDQLNLSFDLTNNFYYTAFKYLEILEIKNVNEDQEFNLDEEFIQKISQEKFETRMIFYVLLRAKFRFQSGFNRKSITFEDAYKKSLHKLIEQMDMFLELKKEIKDLSSGKNNYVESNATYSKRVVPALIFKDSSNFEKLIQMEIFPSKDARNLKANSADLIICDPPYGFNTDEDILELTQLYSEFLSKAIDAIKRRGQLIICLPLESFTGRGLPYCTRSDLISRQIITLSVKKNRQVYKPAYSIPTVEFSAPYYWEAERALKRTILHFYIF